MYQVSYGKTNGSIPQLKLAKWTTSVVTASTGPNAGITQLDLNSLKLDTTQEIGGVSHWTAASDINYGVSQSLYEEDITKDSTSNVGDPIADVYASVIRSNNTVAAIADGCSWGKKPRLAARCAVHAAIEHVCKNTEQFNKNPTSHTLLDLLKEAVGAAHVNILKHNATTTTLSIAVSCLMADGKWGLFTVSVGDSRVFVYSSQYNSFIEVTLGSHPSNGVRSESDCGGSLGMAIGTSPDLENFSFGFTTISPGDIVVLMTDGVTDNFKSLQQPLNSGKQDNEDEGFVFVTADEFETSFQIESTNNSYTLVSMEDIILQDLHHTTPKHIDSCCQISYELHKALCNHYDYQCGDVTARTIADFLVESAAELTEGKRQFRMYCTKNNINIRKQVKENPEFADLKNKQLGKLDHATVLSYLVHRY